jgi:hypothetical protein
MPLSQPEQTVQNIVDEILELRKRRPRAAPATAVPGSRRRVDPPMADLLRRHNVRLTDIGR